MAQQIVAVRIRPLVERELKVGAQDYWDSSSTTVFRKDVSDSLPFVFDHVIGKEEINRDVYNVFGKDIVTGAVKGINGTIFAYGQTSSGKTHTMLGSNAEPGLISYAMNDIFSLVQLATERCFLISLSYNEIYNEEVHDLLTGATNLKIRENEMGEIRVLECGQELVDKPEDVLRLMAEGDKRRHIGATNMNERSSRSHAILTMFIESKLVDDSEDKAVLVSQLNFVDLAGSEKAGQTGAVGQRLKEGSHINSSLHALSLCINKLAEKSNHIPYRDSKLTRLLQNSLGGNSRTAIVANVTPASLEETLSTLRFASRAKKVSSQPVVNEIVDPNTLTRRLEKRVKDLELQLAEKSQVDAKEMKKIIQELLKPPLEERQPSREQRRMTWCPGKARQKMPALNLNSFVEEKADTEQELPNKKRTSLSDMPSTSAKLPKFHEETISDGVEPSYDGTNASALADDTKANKLLELEVDLEMAKVEILQKDELISSLKSSNEEMEKKFQELLNKDQPSGSLSYNTTVDFENASLRSELKEAKLALARKDEFIVSLENANQKLGNELLELEVFTQDEKDVINCRTPGQVVEKRLKAQLKTTETELNELKAELERVKTSNIKLSETVDKLMGGEQLSLGASLMKSSFSKKFFDSPAMRLTPVEQSPDQGVLSQSMPSTGWLDSPSYAELPEVKSVSTTSIQFPSLDSSTDASTHVAAVDAATNTEMDFKWFEFDDTVLGLRKTGVMLNRTLSAEESICQPVPAQVLGNTFVSEVSGEVTDLKAGLEIAYKVINDTQLKLEQAECDKEQLLARVKKNYCGSCDTDVLECEHEQFVPTADWREAQTELEAEVANKQKEITKLENDLVMCEAEHLQKLEQLNTEHEFLLEAAKRHKMGDNEESNEMLELLKTDHTMQMGILRDEYEMKIETMATEHSEAQDLLRSEFKALMEVKQREFTDRYEALKSDNDTNIEALKRDYEQQLLDIGNSNTSEETNSVIESLKTEHAEQITTLTNEYEERIHSVTTEHTKSVEMLKSNHEEHLKTQELEFSTKLDLMKLENEQTVEKLIQEKEQNLPASNTATSEETNLVEFLKTEHAEQMATLTSEYEERIQSVTTEHTKSVEMLKSAHEEHLKTQELEFSTKLDLMKLENEQTVEKLMQEKEQLQPSAETVSSEQTNGLVESLKTEHAEQIATLTNEYEQRIQSVTTEHTESVEMLKSEHEEHLKTQELEFSTKLDLMKLENEQTVEKLMQEKGQLRPSAETVSSEETNSLIESLKTEHAEQITTLTSEYEERIQSVTTEHTKSVEMLKSNYEEHLKAQELEFNTKLDLMKLENSQELGRLKSENQQLSSSVESKLLEETNRLKTEHAEQIATLTKEYEQKIQSVTTEHTKSVEMLKSAHEEMNTNFNGKLLTLESENRQKLEELTVERDQLVISLQKVRAEDEKEGNQSTQSVETVPIQIYNEKCQELDEYMVGALADRRQLVEKYKTCKGKLQQHEKDLNEISSVLYKEVGRTVEEIKEEILRLTASSMSAASTNTPAASANTPADPANTPAASANTPADSASTSVSSNASDPLSSNDVEVLRQQITKELKSKYSLQLIGAEKQKRENKRLKMMIDHLESRLANPEGEVRDARESEEGYKRDSERYHDELNEIDDKIQLFGEEVLGYDSWNIDNLMEGIRRHIPEHVKSAAAEEVSAEKAKPLHIKGPDSLPPGPESKGGLCQHLRKKQHMKIIDLESDKAGLECENIKLKKELKQIPKLMEEIHQLKQKHYELTEEHKKLTDLFQRTEQELYHEREKLKSQVAFPDESSSNLNLSTRFQIKSLESEVFGLNQKNKQLESVLDKLRTKYIHLRHKYDKLVANESKEQSTFGASTLAGAATLNSSSVPTACTSALGDHQANTAAPVEPLNLEAEEPECKTQ